MGIHKMGPRNDRGVPGEESSSRKTGGTTGGFAGRERPFIDDRPAGRQAWDESSRWGSRPTPSRATLASYVRLAWTRIKKATRDR